MTRDCRHCAVRWGVLGWPWRWRCPGGGWSDILYCRSVGRADSGTGYHFRMYANAPRNVFLGRTGGRTFLSAGRSQTGSGSMHWSHCVASARSLLAKHCRERPWMCDVPFVVSICEATLVIGGCICILDPLLHMELAKKVFWNLFYQNTFTYLHTFTKIYLIQFSLCLAI